MVELKNCNLIHSTSSGLMLSNVEALKHGKVVTPLLFGCLDLQTIVYIQKVEVGR